MSIGCGRTAARAAVLDFSERNAKAFLVLESIKLAIFFGSLGASKGERASPRGWPLALVHAQQVELYLESIKTTTLLALLAA